MSVRVTCLGSGDAFCSAGNHQASYLVQSKDTSILMDCGATALASLKRLQIRTSSLDTVLISHLHGDHFAGLPFIFLDLTYVDPRRRPLTIAGPPGIEQRVRELFRAMYRDAAAEPLPFAVDYVELWPDKACDVQGARVDPFRVPHQLNDISLGFRVDAENQSILYSGDTGWTDALVSHSTGADLFLCECTFFETRLATHLDYPTIAANRSRFGARRLILTHLGAEVLARRSEIDAELAHDGLRIDLSRA